MQGARRISFLISVGALPFGQLRSARQAYWRPDLNFRGIPVRLEAIDTLGLSFADPSGTPGRRRRPVRAASPPRLRCRLLAQPWPTGFGLPYRRYPYRAHVQLGCRCRRSPGATRALSMKSSTSCRLRQMERRRGPPLTSAESAPEWISAWTVRSSNPRSSAARGALIQTSFAGSGMGGLYEGLEPWATQISDSFPLHSDGGPPGCEVVRLSTPSLVLAGPVRLQEHSRSLRWQEKPARALPSSFARPRMPQTSAGRPWPERRCTKKGSTCAIKVAARGTEREPPGRAPGPQRCRHAPVGQDALEQAPAGTLSSQGKPRCPGYVRRPHHWEAGRSGFARSSSPPVLSHACATQVTAGTCGDHFAVSDSGLGFPSERLAHVFERVARWPIRAWIGPGLWTASDLGSACGVSIQP